MSASISENECVSIGEQCNPSLAQDADVWLFIHRSLQKTNAINLRRRRYGTYATPALASVLYALIYRDDCTDFPIQLHNLVRYIHLGAEVSDFRLSSALCGAISVYEKYLLSL